MIVSWSSPKHSIYSHASSISLIRIPHISLHSRVGSLPALLLLLLLQQQEHLFQVKIDKLCFLGSWESTALPWLSLISTPGSFDLPLVIGSCFLATDLIQPTKKEGGSFQGLAEVWLTVSHVQLSLEQCGKQRITLLLLLLSQPFCFGTITFSKPQQSRDQVFYYSRASLLSLHVRVAEVYLESLTRVSKVNKIRSAVSTSHKKKP